LSPFKIKCGFDPNLALNADESTIIYSLKFGEHIEKLAKEMITEINGDMI
jgi:hypothetical protein